ncbi:hypothetical protein BZA05DRAFT_198566 [Tricharina praecox]|uniref:uncharacterized protein n=1 Tax=Tricharina praecox TaxID=43433 RepID=UPI00221E5CD2|nr:uncharacterized protein BZA05DRAFT_198566 [Tricharina praecox]KAI5856337.1 hypothetical protein BZA05DRAFT_198566 [Tricharina praecox]
MSGEYLPVSYIRISSHCLPLLPLPPPSPFPFPFPSITHLIPIILLLLPVLRRLHYRSIDQIAIAVLHALIPLIDGSLGVGDRDRARAHLVLDAVDVEGRGGFVGGRAALCWPRCWPRCWSWYCDCNRRRSIYEREQHEIWVALHGGYYV